MAEKPIVSIFIAAYNTPDYTRKTLQSIVEQVYRPIELVFSDDCSPILLEPLVNEFRCYESANFTIHFFRQPSNLRGIDNMTFGFDQCSGKYVVNMPHDDWWIDKYFLIEAVDLMESNPNCYLSVANSEVEKSDCQLMIKLPESLNAKNKWQITKGDKYINLLGYGRIGHQAYSAVVFNRPVGQSLGVYHTPFNISNKEADTLGLIPDEFFSSQFLLASVGDVAITEKVVSVRGRPETSFCNSTPQWKNIVGQAAFMAHYNIYKVKLKGIYADAVKTRAKESIYEYPVEKINLMILKHYNYSKDAIWLMFCSYLVGLYRRIFYLPRYYCSLGRRLLRAIRDKEISQLIANQKARGIRRILRLIFPF